MRQSRKKMINVTCSQTIKKQVDTFLASQYKAWRTMLNDPSNSKNQDGLKGYFSCTNDHSNTLLMEYVRYIYKEYGIADPLAIENQQMQDNGKARLSDLVKEQRQSFQIADQTKRTSFSPPYKPAKLYQDAQSPIKLIESQYSPENNLNTPVKKGKYNEELSNNMRTHGHKRQSSDYLKINMTTGRTQSKFQTQNSVDLLRNSGSSSQRKSIKFLFGGSEQKSQEYPNINRSFSRNVERSQQLQNKKQSIPNNFFVPGPGRNTLIKIEDVNENNGSNQSSKIKNLNSTEKNKQESPIKQQSISQKVKFSEINHSHQKHLNFSRKINSLTLRSDQPVPEIYRYCLACQNAVLEVNIERHEVMCQNFKQLYDLDLQGLLNHLQNKIQNIRGKLEGQAEHLQENDAQKMKNLSRQLSRQSISIFKSGSLTNRFIDDYNSAISIGKKWGQTSENVNKLRWFVKVRQQLKEHFDV